MLPIPGASSGYVSHSLSASTRARTISFTDIFFASVAASPSPASAAARVARITSPCALRSASSSAGMSASGRCNIAFASIGTAAKSFSASTRTAYGARRSGAVSASTRASRWFSTT